MGLSRWLNDLADTRDNFLRGFRRFQRSKNPLSQAMNTGIETIMNTTGFGSAVDLGLTGANAALNAITGRSDPHEIANKMKEVEQETGISPAAQAQLLGTDAILNS